MAAGEGTVGIEEAARICGVSEETIRRRLRAGRLAHAQREPGPSGAWRIPVADLMVAGLTLSTQQQSSGPSADVTVLQLALEHRDALLREKELRILELQEHVADLRRIITKSEVK